MVKLPPAKSCPKSTSEPKKVCPIYNHLALVLSMLTLAIRVDFHSAQINNLLTRGRSLLVWACGLTWQQSRSGKELGFLGIMAGIGNAEGVRVPSTRPEKWFIQSLVFPVSCVFGHYFAVLIGF